ncbi:DEAD/DEAH box helicase family protein [Streptomyces sp. NPDC006339]|uniref:DEAD/DEAH box helicase family protein n=1 Tax=Streptomyces sp. NPDC006339 TaxID=3156755 RepID=UPI00339DB0CB
MISLREHQVTQKTAIREWVKFSARSSVPAQGARGTLLSATGSGKTITAAASALESFPAGRILVTVPTLDLLAQTDINTAIPLTPTHCHPTTHSQGYQHQHP